jgi:hypothetical protein
LSSFFLQNTAATYAFSTPKGDLAASMTIVWSLFGVFVHQTTQFIHWSTLTFVILASVWVLKCIVMQAKTALAGALRLQDGEREPLIGGS